MMNNVFFDSPSFFSARLVSSQVSAGLSRAIFSCPGNGGVGYSVFSFQLTSQHDYLTKIPQIHNDDKPEEQR